MAKTKATKKAHAERLRFVTVHFSAKKVKEKPSRKVTERKDGSVVISGVNRKGYRYRKIEYRAKSKDSSKIIRKAERELRKRMEEQGGKASVHGQFYKGRFNKASAKAYSGTLKGSVYSFERVRLEKKPKRAKKGEPKKPLKTIKVHTIGFLDEMFDLVTERLEEFAKEYNVESAWSE